MTYCYHITYDMIIIITYQREVLFIFINTGQQQMVNEFIFGGGYSNEV